MTNKDSFIEIVSRNETLDRKFIAKDRIGYYEYSHNRIYIKCRMGAEYYSYETLESFQAKLG